MKVQRESVSFDEDSPALVVGVRDVLQGSWVIVTTLLLPSIAPHGFVHPIFCAPCPLSRSSAKVCL